MIVALLLLGFNFETCFCTYVDLSSSVENDGFGDAKAYACMHFDIDGSANRSQRSPGPHLPFTRKATRGRPVLRLGFQAYLFFS